MHRWTHTAFLWVTLLACTSDGRFQTTGVDALGEAGSIEVRTFEGESCAAFEDLTAGFATAPLSILRARRNEDLSGSLPNRSHVVVAWVFDGACEIIGYGCAEATPGEDLNLVVSAVPPTSCECSLDVNDTCRIDTDPPDAGVGDACPGPSLCPSPPSEGVDSDADGASDSDECPGLACCPDSDGDGYADYCDVDSDDDGAIDAEECPLGPCGASTNPAQTLCDGEAVSLLDVAHCGACNAACTQTMCLERDRSLRQGFCAPIGVSVGERFDRGMDNPVEPFALSLHAIDLSGMSRPAREVGDAKRVIDVPADQSVFLQLEDMDEAAEDAASLGFGACRPSLGFRDCLFAFAIEMLSLSDTLDPRCTISENFILFVVDGVGGTYNTPFGPRLVEPGWTVLRREAPGLAYEQVPLISLRAPIPVGNADASCRSADEYVF